MTVQKSAASLLCIAAALFAALAQAQPDDASATAHRLMIRSGMSVQLRGFTDQISADLRQNAGAIDASLIAALSDAAKEAYRPELLQRDMTARVAKKLTLSDMNAALAWLETDAGKRVTRAEEIASTSLDAERLGQYAERLQAKPLPAQRQKMIAELMAAVGAVRAAAAVAESMALGVALGMDALQPRERRVGEAVLRARIRQAMPPEKMHAFLAEQLPVISAYTYRDVSDEDLASYLAFLRGVAGKRYQDGFNAAFIEALSRASVQLGELAAQNPRQTKL